ncbi:SGNH/GDSL hydrolase family protein [uncultured Polaribacter sp.]|uniref:SGNH/GDSL hydrolase family protein n=1 Tax=uncultured Polaribacter sp. TaxID=174711 RepID=UPI00259BB9A6|nr:SGNH/GDSL hydrolase family protein [uncultured Polaribacter sp.]
MKKFFYKISFFLFTALLSLQMFYGKTPSIFNPRVFYGFSKNKIDMWLSEEGSNIKVEERIYLNPDGQKVEIRKNNVGFNAHLDYDSIHNNQIALIGDSFIASYNCGVYKSIAYYLDNEIEHRVYNFGLEGGNINDYYKIYNEFKLHQLSYVFIFLTGEQDLIYKNPLSYRYKIKDIEELSFLNNFNIKKFFVDKKNLKTFNSPNYSLLKSQFKNIILVLHKGIRKEQLPVFFQNKVIDLNDLKINTFSDGHYTGEGNKVIADVLKSFLNNYEKKGK